LEEIKALFFCTLYLWTTAFVFPLVIIIMIYPIFSFPEKEIYICKNKINNLQGKTINLMMFWQECVPSVISLQHNVFFYQDIMRRTNFVEVGFVAYQSLSSAFTINLMIFPELSV
jgi:hypothetical protein